MKPMRTILLTIGLALSLLSNAQQHIYTVADSGRFVSVYDTTAHIRYSYGKNTLAVNCSTSYISLFSANNNYLVADWTIQTISNLAPNIDSGCRKLNYIIFGDTLIFGGAVQVKDSNVVYATPHYVLYSIPKIIVSQGNNTTTYTNSLLSSRNILFLTLGGIALKPGRDYSLSGTTLTFPKVIHSYSTIQIQYE